MNIRKYRKRPEIIIEAVQYTGDNHDDVALWAKGKDGRSVIIKDDLYPYPEVWDFLNTTWIKLHDGDWVVRGIKGEYYPVHPEVFGATYEVA